MVAITKAKLLSSLTIIEDQYPIRSSVEYYYRSIEWKLCAFNVLGFRDLVRNPLTVEEFLCRPMLRRSRYALRVEEIAGGPQKMIYQRLLHSEFRECPLRVGVYLGSELVELISTNRGPSIADRLGPVRYLNQFDDYDFGEHFLGVLSDDGEVVTTDSFGCAPEFLTERVML